MRRYKTMTLRDLLNLALKLDLEPNHGHQRAHLLSVLAFCLRGEVIRGFAVAMVWGIVIGTYSTICVAAPLLLYMHLHRHPRQGTHGQVQERQDRPAGRLIQPWI